ncbi:MAG: [protein-PII] uridylyltransferase [Myxococcota bacterium]|jgi:[protein-PII] uridylyltransferase
MSFADEHRAGVLAALTDDPYISGQALCETVTYAVDTIVVEAAQRAMERLPASERDGRVGLPERWALMALGGYGRTQMCLRSDIDIQLVVPDGSADPRPFMQTLMDELSQRRLRLGHGVRTISESVMLAREEPTFATAALSSRHLLGDPAITEAIRGPVYHYMAGPGLRDLVERIRIDRSKRAERLGDTVFVLEPDLKNGVGGLRDAQLVGWLTLITGRPYDRKVLFAEDALLKYRMALHASVSFKCDRLAFEYQDTVADALGLRGRRAEDLPAIELMRRVHHAMRVISARARRQLEYAADWLRTPTRVPWGHTGKFVIVGDRLARSDGAPFQTTDDIIDALTVVARNDLPFEARLEDHLEAFTTHLGEDASSDPALNVLLLHLLVEPLPGASRAIHTMHRAGLLTAIVPEFGRIVGRVQRDLYHVYTVDEHILRAVDRLKALARGELETSLPLATHIAGRVARRRALSVALFLHDVGKGFGPGHHARGVELVKQIGPRLGLSEEDIALATLLVRHQADMALICLRRDLGDPAPIRRLARVVKTVATLDALFLLTVADWSSVGPDAFTSWHQTLLRQLYERTRQLIEEPGLFYDPEGVAEALRARLVTAELGELPEAPGALSDPIDDFCAVLPTRYFHAKSADVMEQHYLQWRQWRAQNRPHGGLRPSVVDVAHIDDTEATMVSVVCHDRPGVLAKLTGGLTKFGCSILSAEIQALPSGAVLDIFHVADPHSRISEPRAADRIRGVLADALDDESVDPTRGEQQEQGDAWVTPADALPRVEPVVTVSNTVATGHSVFDVTVGDADGLLYRLAQFFHQAGVSVDLAFVSTEGRVARDSFYVVDADGAKLAAGVAKQIATELQAALADAESADV